MGDIKELSSRRLIRPHNGGVVKPFEKTTTCHNERVDTKETTSPTKTSDLLSTLLFTLDLRQFQLRPRLRRKVGHPPERVAESVAREGEVRQVPEGGYRNFVQDTEGYTVSVGHGVDPTKSGYLKFYPGGMSTINKRKLYQESESNKASRGETNKNIEEILEMPQETSPENCKVKVPSSYQ